IPALAPMLEPGLAQMQEQMRMFTAMQGGMQGLENNPGEQMVRSVLRDGKTGVLGLKASGMGLTASVATTFKEGSELAQIFEGGGDASPLLARLPDAEFLFAYAVDLSSPVARTII